MAYGNCISINPYAACWLIWPIQNDAKNIKKNTKTLANGYSYASTRRELFN